VTRPSPLSRPGRGRSRTLLAACTGAGLVLPLLLAAPAAAGAAPPAATAPSGAAPAGAVVAGAAGKQPRAVGRGGAVASVDLDATRVGTEVLRAGGNAVDAAVATAAALGVTEPYSSGIGGGGFLVAYDARTGEVTTLDGRETAPASTDEDVFTGPGGVPLPFASVVSSGLSVGVPGTPALWARAARELGTRPLGELLRPAERLARDGFVVDETFAQQTRDNEARFRRFPETARVYLPGGQVPAVGSTFRNPDLARAYRVLGRHGVRALYRGQIGKAVVEEARSPRTAPGVEVLPGQITRRDLRGYRVLEKAPTRSTYRGLEVVGMPVPSSGGIAVGEALNLLEAFDAQTGRALPGVTRVQYLHRFAEATATAFADRNRFVGDVPDVPVRELLSQDFAEERACQVFDPRRAAPRPIAPGSPDGEYGCPAPRAGAQVVRDDAGTTHLTTVDAQGSVASYTLTIEQTGGSGITVPGWGFLLNNELTDFEFVPPTPGVPHPNLPGPGKRPRSSMAPTIVLQGGVPVLALGSPGGSTIITTVAQVLTGHLDRDLGLLEAVAAPRISSRNGSSVQAEAPVLDGPVGQGLRDRGHVLSAVPELGAAAAVALRPGGRLEAVAEPRRRGGGAAMVVRPTR